MPLPSLARSTAPGRRGRTRLAPMPACSSPRSPSLPTTLLVFLALVVPGAGLSLSGEAFGQALSNDGPGRPIVRNYDHRDFGAEAQNWGVLQGDSGLVYFANHAGVLEFDGRTWRLIELPARLSVRSLTREGGGTGPIYVGAQGDIGYLGHDLAGQLQFTSLLPVDARRDRAFTAISRPVVTSSGVYFHLRRSVCRLVEDQLRCRETDSALSGIFSVGEHAYVQQQGVGLVQIVESSLRPVPGGDRFIGEDITVLLPYRTGGEDRLLVGTRGLGLFLQRGSAFEPFGPGITDPRLEEDQLVSGAVLPDGSLALGTRARGVLIVNRRGAVRQQIDRSTGLQDNHVHGIWPDRQGGLWLALQHGVSRVELGSPFTIFDEASGLEREWREVVRHQGVLYVRGYKGLFAGTGDTRARGVAGTAPATRSPRFSRITEIDPPVWSLVDVGHSLLATSRDGIYEIQAGRPRRIATYTSLPMALHRAPSDPDRVYVGLADGLASLRLDGRSWIDEGRVEGIDETVTSVAEGGNGDLWLVAQGQRAILVRFEEDGADAAAGRQRSRPRPTEVRRFGPEAMTGRVSVRRIAGRSVFLTEDGILEFDEASRGFVPVAGLASLAGAGRRSFSWIAEDPHGNIWAASRTPGGVDFLWKQPDGRYVLDNAGLRQIPVWSIYPDPQGSLVWFCTPDYLLRYDSSIRTTPPQFKTWVRQVLANGDRVVFGGGTLPDPPQGRDRERVEPALHATANSLRFEFAAGSYDDAERNEFQSYLEGFDRGWSAWGHDATRAYTNLPQGRYRFRARGRDVRGETGEEAIFAFSILPPWYLSAWAYALYLGLACGSLVVAVSRNRRKTRERLERQREHLELEKLREMDRLKSRFFADVSHEFRTPLSLILGPVGQLIDETTESSGRQKLEIVRRHAEYLMRLITQLLDLSKLEAGRMRLCSVPGDLAQDLTVIVSPFLSVAEAQGVQFDLDLPLEPAAPACFDRDVIEKIVNNLLGNALKFTPPGGAVSVSFRRPGVVAGRGVEAAAREMVEIAVSDTGIGIPPEDLPRVFERFYQAGSIRSREGFGIGLAMVKELAELHGGTVFLQSHVGQGTTVVVRVSVGGLPAREPHEAQSPALTVPEAQPGARAAAPGADSSEVVMVPARAPAPGARPATGDRATVLVVEDHPELRAFLRELLERDYRVAEASDGSEGLREAMSLVPGLVLSDLMMRNMDGLEMCRALKTHEKTSHIPIVLLTARAGRDDTLLGLDAGADRYLVKPFDPPELLATVRNLVEQRRVLRQRFSGSLVLKPSEMAVVPADQAFLARVLAVVERNLDDPAFDVEHLGRAVGLSRSQLHRKLRTLTHQPPTMLIRSIRLERAAELLVGQAGSIAEIAYGVGFSSQAYFARCFRDQFGVSPREYRVARADAQEMPPQGRRAQMRQD
jgi:signal transduction histidine kinase/DNA-binding response OmpR family regulator